MLQASTYDQIKQQQKNIEQPKNISQTINRETTAETTIVVVDPRRTYINPMLGMNLIRFSVTHIILLQFWDWCDLEKVVIFHKHKKLKQLSEDKKEDLDC